MVGVRDPRRAPGRRQPARSGRHPAPLLEPVAIRLDGFRLQMKRDRREPVCSARAPARDRGLRGLARRAGARAARRGLRRRRDRRRHRGAVVRREPPLRRRGARRHAARPGRLRHPAPAAARRQRDAGRGADRARCGDRPRRRARSRRRRLPREAVRVRRAARPAARGGAPALRSRRLRDPDR